MEPEKGLVLFLCSRERPSNVDGPMSLNRLETSLALVKDRKTGEHPLEDIFT